MTWKLYLLSTKVNNFYQFLSSHNVASRIVRVDKKDAFHLFTLLRKLAIATYGLGRNAVVVFGHIDGIFEKLLHRY